MVGQRRREGSVGDGGREGEWGEWDGVRHHLY